LILLAWWPFGLLVALVKRGVRLVTAPVVDSAWFKGIAAFLKRDFWRSPARQSDDAGAMLERAQLLRRLLVPLVAAQWAAMLVFGSVAGFHCIFGALPYSSDILGLAFLTVFLSGTACYVGRSCYERLQKCWRALQYAVCECCGYIREFSDSDRCPECGSHRHPVPPGQLPPTWIAWEPIVGGFAANVPYAMLGAVVMPVFGLTKWVSLWVLGVVAWALTISFTTLAALAICAVLLRLSLIHISEPTRPY